MKLHSLKFTKSHLHLFTGARQILVSIGCLLLLATTTHGRESSVELQPFAAQVTRLIDTMDNLGEPFSAADKQALTTLFDEEDEARAIVEIQRVLDRRSLIVVHISPESRVSVSAGQAKAELYEGGWRAFLVKVRNEAGVTAQLKAESRNALQVFRRPSTDYPGTARPKQSVTRADVARRWLDLSMYDKPPLMPRLSGLQLEYRVILLYSRDRGQREAEINFNVGQGTQDIGFRNNVHLLFNCRPSTSVQLKVRDEHDKATTASFIIRDKYGRVYPPLAKRLAPDFAFQPQVYRHDGERLKLPAGDYEVEYTRGPEYQVKKQIFKVVQSAKPLTWKFNLERWIDPTQQYKWYSGDHHIHAAGCSHYESPTQGVLPQHIIRHIKGEALSVGAVLTWGPCYYFQKQFFEARTNKLSTANNLMRYDLEVSGFPSSHNGHLVLLRLREQDYPGATKIEDWPTWDLPILKWAKRQGAITGFAHSGWGLEVKSNELPNYELPAFDGIGANEYIVDVAHDAVDFISTVDTPYPWELNIWYHTLNCGFRTRVSGETDFPCIYGERVGVGRSYVQLDNSLNYDSWVRGLRDGRSYVSDGKSHFLDFRVDNLAVGTEGSELKLDEARRVRVTAKVAARLEVIPNEAIRARALNEQPYWNLERSRIGDTREVPVEVIVNGHSVRQKNIVADGTTMHDLTFDIAIKQSSWIALRILPSSHTNPIFVTINDQPVRASRRSAEWCLKAVDQCWNQKATMISAQERIEARKAYEHARQVYRLILAQSTAE